LITSRMAAAGAAIAASVAIAACGSSSSKSSGGTASSSAGSTSSVSATINGAGSTFAAPIYQQWGSTLKSQGLTVNYNPVGSGTGVADLQTATATFAGDDGALKADEKAKMKGPVLQFPVAFGSITLSYNLPGVKSGLKLDGGTIANIFLGRITKWNDAAIKALNPGLNLPSSSITVAHRSDSSGTTQGFTTYLSQVSGPWKAAVGKGKIVKWVTGTGGKGNSGVAAIVKQTPGAVGYVEQAYAIENSFTYAAVKNAAGSFVLPSISATSAAANGIKVPADLGISTINSPNPAAYPIASQTFLDVYQDPCKSGGASTTVAKGVKGFLSYAFGQGQSTLGQGGDQIPYAPLPSALQAKDNAQLATMTCNGAAIK
jgi:phosphate transport system substrate-binding protein